MSDTFNIDAARKFAAEATERADAATEGPWVVDLTGDVEEGILNFDIIQRPQGTSPTHRIACMELYDIDDATGNDQTEADAEFIAAARTDVPALSSRLAAACDYLDKLTAERDEAIARNDLFSDCLHRALKLWQAAHPAASYWPDGAVNIAWVMAENTRLTAERDALVKAADKLTANAHEYSKDDGYGALALVFADDVNELIAALRQTRGE